LYVDSYLRKEFNLLTFALTLTIRMEAALFREINFDLSFIEIAKESKLLGL
jgi:hypothetical protein